MQVRVNVIYIPSTLNNCALLETCDKHLYEKRNSTCAVFTVKPIVDPALSLIENSVMSLRL